MISLGMTLISSSLAGLLQCGNAFAKPMEALSQVGVNQSCDESQYIQETQNRIDRLQKILDELRNQEFRTVPDDAFMVANDLDLTLKEVRGELSDMGEGCRPIDFTAKFSIANLIADVEKGLKNLQGKRISNSSRATNRKKEDLNESHS